MYLDKWGFVWGRGGFGAQQQPHGLSLKSPTDKIMAMDDRNAILGASSEEEDQAHEPGALRSVLLQPSCGSAGRLWINLIYV